MGTIEQIDEFTRFAKLLIEKEGAGIQLDAIFDRWHEEAFRDEDLIRIQASVDDYKAGEQGQPAKEVLDEFRKERAAGKNK